MLVWRWLRFKKAAIKIRLYLFINHIILSILTTLSYHYLSKIKYILLSFIIAFFTIVIFFQTIDVHLVSKPFQPSNSST